MPSTSAINHGNDTEVVGRAFADPLAAKATPPVATDVDAAGALVVIVGDEDVSGVGRGEGAGAGTPVVVDFVAILLCVAK